MSIKYPMLPRISNDKKTLMGSKDLASGRTYYPPRYFADDGSMRETEQVTLSTSGVLYSYSEFRGMGFGHVDLPEGTRIPTILGDGPHKIGSNYTFELIDKDTNKWKFVRA